MKSKKLFIKDTLSLLFENFPLLALLYLGFNLLSIFLVEGLEFLITGKVSILFNFWKEAESPLLTYGQEALLGKSLPLGLFNIGGAWAIYFLLHVLFITILIHIVHLRSQKQKLTWSTISKRFKNSLPAVTTTTFLSIVIMGALPVLSQLPFPEALQVFLAPIGALLLIILSIYFIYAQTMSALLNLHAIDALRQSIQMVTGNWWKTLGRILLLGLVGIGITIPVFITLAIIFVTILSQNESLIHYLQDFETNIALLTQGQHFLYGILLESIVLICTVLLELVISIGIVVLYLKHKQS